MQAILAACGAGILPPVARSLQDRLSLAGFWISDKNATGIAADKYRRCWIYHLAMKPFYLSAPIGLVQRMSMRLFPLWGSWIRRQKAPSFDVAYAIMGHGTELFELADRTGALKVIDASSSHPTSFFGFWQRECDLWCPGEQVLIPRSIFARCNRELERADLILCPSNFVLESMLYNGIPETKCALNPYGVDTSTFTRRPSVPNKPRFVCVGGICLRKGQQYLLRAFDKVRANLKDAELVLVGSHFPDFRKERQRWEGTYTHYENLPAAAVAKILRESTAFVFPSNEEGFARAIIEAMGAGLPIIATHQSGATTLVDDGVEGFIVRNRDIDHIAEAMLTVAANPELNEKMGRAAFERGAKGNTWGDHADRVIQICGAALDSRKR